MKYLPQKGKKGPKVNKEFVWRILKTLRPTWTENVLKSAAAQRK